MSGAISRIGPCFKSASAACPPKQKVQHTGAGLVGPEAIELLAQDGFEQASVGSEQSLELGALRSTHGPPPSKQQPAAPAAVLPRRRERTPGGGGRRADRPPQLRSAQAAGYYLRSLYVKAVNSLICGPAAERFPLLASDRSARVAACRQAA
jgi:hypothetical protein